MADPAGHPGFILTAPPEESLVWDLENEITSVWRRRLPGGTAWWIADSYRETVGEILSRLRLRLVE